MILSERKFYHSEKLQSTKTILTNVTITTSFYHSEKLQSTKTVGIERKTYG